MPESIRVVLHPVHGPGLGDELKSNPLIDLVAPSSEAGVVPALRDGARGLITFKWEDAFAGEDVEWIQALSAGVDQFPLDLLRERGIVLTGARGTHSPAVAEHAVALMMSLLRGIGPSMRHASDAVWKPGTAYEAAGRTLGIVGLGSIGEQVARLGAGLGMKVIGLKRRPEGYDGAAVDVVGPQGLLELCRRSDVVVLALPESPDTRHLIGAAELEAIGAGWMVNVGRGSVVDEEALVEALTTGRLQGAALDVTEVEPLPGDSPLWRLENVVVTPHMAWSTDLLPGRLAAVIDANAKALLRGTPWLNRET